MKGETNNDAAVEATARTDLKGSEGGEMGPDRNIARRDFIQRVAVASAAAGTGLTGFGATAERQTDKGPKPPPAVLPFVGIQMGPHTMLDEGIERCLDLIQETAAVNAVMPYSHGYNNAFFKPLRNRADHGVPLTDNAGRKFPLVWSKLTTVFTKTQRCDTSASAPPSSTPATTSSLNSPNPAANAD